MPEQFMRIGGSDGTVARGLRTDNIGTLQTKLSNQFVIKQTITRAGSYTNVLGGEEFVIYNWVDLGRSSLSWFLSMQEIARPTNEIVNTCKIKIEYSTSPTGEKIHTVFSKIVDLSLEDSFDKALVLGAEEDYVGNNNRVSNIILRAKPFNLPLARYMRITLINTQTPTLTFQGIVLTEEGVY